jgi:hypothetical protein
MLAVYGGQSTGVKLGIVRVRADQQQSQGSVGHRSSAPSRAANDQHVAQGRFHAIARIARGQGTPRPQVTGHYDEVYRAVHQDGLRTVV